MRTLSVCLFAAAIATSVEAAGRTRNENRNALIAALERMIETGEPHHASHDQGELLQRAVTAALSQQDEEIELLAMRASAMITGRIFRPIIAADESIPLSISARLVFNLPHPVAFRARIMASVDGGETVQLGYVDSGQEVFELAGALPWTARLPGAHHLRLRALLTFEGTDGAVVPQPECRDLPELVYAVYDRRHQDFGDARAFLFSPAGVSAQQMDHRLPDMPLALWLNSVLIARGGEPINEFNWRISFCDERTREPGLAFRRLDLCSVFHFQLGFTFGQIWIRTGRIELADTSVQWLATPPTFEAIRFMQSASSESHDLAFFENLLDTSPNQLPVPDASIAAEEIVITPIPRRPNAAQVSITVRNKGDADLHGLYVEVIGGDFDRPSLVRHFLRDIPRQGSVQLDVGVTYPRGYGIIVVLLLPSLTDYSPWVTSSPEDPTRGNNLVFRAINPQRAPSGFVASIKRRCGEECRGY